MVILIYIVLCWIGYCACLEFAGSAISAYTPYYPAQFASSQQHTFGKANAKQRSQIDKVERKPIPNNLLPVLFSGKNA